MNSDKIRRYFDQKSQKWYFSISDVIGALTNTANPRNYWKVLKNRLKNRRPELVTKCNQLKMMAKDGKFYLTDTADRETMISIIESIPKASVEALKVLIEELEEITENLPLNYLKSHQNLLTSDVALPQEENIDAGAELLVDVYENNNKICIEAMIAGVMPEDLNIFVTPKKVIIKGKREVEENKTLESYSKDYLFQELLWTDFRRVITLPFRVEINKVEKFYERGHLIIKLEKI